MTVSYVNKRWIFPAIAVMGMAYFILLFYRGFSDPDEGRYAEIPREMIAGGKWLEMRMLGYRYYEKPPFSYWLVLPAIKFLGVSDSAARVPLLASCAAGLFFLGLASIRKFGLQNGVMSLLVMASTVGFFAGNAMLLTDSFLLPLFSGACIFSYLAFDGNAPPGRRYLFLMLGAVAAVLGFLTKGAVAVVLPAGIIFVWLLWEKRVKALLALPVLSAILLWFLLIIPVLWLIEQHNPGFFRHFVYEEHIARFQGTRQTQLHPEPFWFFFKVLPLLLLPWFLFLFRAARNIRAKRVFSQDSFSRFLFVWLAVVICFFSASTGKLMSYILPAIPPLGLLIGRWGVVEPVDDRQPWDRKLWQTGLAGLFIIFAVLVGMWIISFSKIWPATIYPITAISVIALLPPIVIFMAVLISAGKIDFGKVFLLNSGILLACALLLSPLAGKDFNVLLHINSSFVYKSLARELKPEDTIVVFWSYRPALPFYTGRLYVPFQERNELSYGMKMEPGRPVDLENVRDIAKLWDKCSGRIFALVEPQDLKSKFPALELKYKETGLPRDPDTIIYELIRPL